MTIQDIKKAIKKAYVTYIEQKHSGRNSKPANIVHEAINQYIKLNIIKDQNFHILSSASGGEYKFESKYHTKRIDITVIDKDNNLPVVAISFKMPLSSVNKNLRNYFEMNTGDTTIVKSNGTPFYFFMVLDANSIKFSGSEKSLQFDKISETSISPFLKVMQENQYVKLKPNFTFITKVDFGDEDFKRQFIEKSKKNFIMEWEKHKRLVEEKEIIAQVLTPNGRWNKNFDKLLSWFFDSINLEIELYKIRKKLHQSDL